MAYIIGAILIIIILVIVGLVMRKKIYNEVDRQESWKMDIMERNIASELSRIKNLNLSGETQEKFESWKSRWEHIVENDLTKIEEHLFDAEEAADRYRFPTAKKVIKETDEALRSIESNIEQILNELDELMKSEKESRKKMEEIKPAIKEMKRQLIQNRYRYGKAIDLFENKVESLENDFFSYQDLTEQGNYMQASKLAGELATKVSDLEAEINIFPELLSTCRTTLPQQLTELLRGIQEMKEDGYRVEPFGFEKEIRTYLQRLEDSLNMLENLELEEPKTIIKETEERVAEMYALLEKEAISKNYIETHYAAYEEALATLTDEFQHTEEEVNLLKQSYHFDDRDLEKYMTIEKAINQLKSEKLEMDENMEDFESTSYTELRKAVEHHHDRIAKIESDLEDFRHSIHNLRKDEIAAKDTLNRLRKEINEINRLLQKSNIPGVPHFIWSYMNEASEKNNNVLALIDKQPLDMIRVQEALEEAESKVNHLAEQTEYMLDQAHLTEQVIQYANRYRSQLPELAAELAKAENFFRKYDYELSLETAAQAIEKVEPGALKKIENIQRSSETQEE